MKVTEEMLDETVAEMELARKVAEILGRSFNNIYYNMPLAEQIEELVKVIENEIPNR